MYKRNKNQNVKTKKTKQNQEEPFPNIIGIYFHVKHDTFLLLQNCR